jgi:hypothetical protein
LLPLGQPGPEDVAGRIDVGVVGVTARPAAKYGPDAIPSVDMAAVGASLGGVAGVNPDELPASIFRFVGQHPTENSPACIENGAVQGRLGGGAVGIMASFVIWARRRTARHIGDPEVFNNYRVVGVHQSA